MAYINGRRVVGMMRSAGGGESSTLLTTTTNATLVSGSTYELALTYLTETPKVNDFIAYVDNGAVTTLYKVTAVDSTNATLEKIGDIGGGGISIPLIVIDTSTQEVDSDQYQLTAEQYSQIENADIIKIAYSDYGTPQVNNTTYVKTQNVSDNAIVFTLNEHDGRYGDGLQCETIYIDRTTHILTYTYDTYVKVEANPTLAGTESNLTGIEIDGTKYAIPAGGGKQLYEHNVKISQRFQMSGNWDETIDIFLKIINDSNSEINTYQKIENFLKDNNFRWNTDYSWSYCYPYEANGSVYDAIADKEYSIRGIYALYNVNSGNFQKIQFIIRRNTQPVTFMYIDSSALVQDKVRTI